MKLKPSLIKWLGQIDEVEKVVVRFKVLELDSAELENAGLVAALARVREASRKRRTATSLWKRCHQE